VARQEASKLRMVALSIAPTLNIDVAEEWIASNASLLNLGLVAIRYSVAPGAAVCFLAKLCLFYARCVQVPPRTNSKTAPRFGPPNF